MTIQVLEGLPVVRHTCDTGVFDAEHSRRDRKLSWRYINPRPPTTCDYCDESLPATVEEARKMAEEGRNA